MSRPLPDEMLHQIFSYHFYVDDNDFVNERNYNAGFPFPCKRGQNGRHNDVHVPQRAMIRTKCDGWLRLRRILDGHVRWLELLPAAASKHMRLDYVRAFFFPPECIIS